MALSISQTVTGTATSSTTLSLSSWTPSANDLIIVWVAIRKTVTVSSISGNGLTFVNVAGATRQGTQNQERLECWRAQGVSPTTGQITITFSGTAVAAVAVAHRIAGASALGTNGSDAVEVAASADTGATDTASPSVSITTATANSLVIGGVSHRNQTFSVGTGETSISLNNTIGTAGDVTTLSTEYQNVAAAGSVTIDGSLSSAIDWTIGAVAIKPGGALYAFTSTIASLSTTPDTVALPVARALASTLASLSTVNDSAVLGLALQLVSSIASSSTTPDTAAILAIVNLLSTIASSSTTPDTVALPVARGLTSTIASSSTVNDSSVLGLALKLISSIASSSTVNDLAVLGVALQLASTIASQSTTPNTLSVLILVQLASSIASSSTTPDTASVAVARALVSAIASESTTGAIDFEPILTALAHHVARILARRYSFIVRRDSAFTVRSQIRTFEAKYMAVAEVVKDPDEELIYTFDFSSALNGDTITASVWTAESDLTVDADSNTTTTTTVKLSGGTLGRKLKAKNVVTLAGGEVLVRRLVVVLQEQ